MPNSNKETHVTKTKRTLVDVKLALAAKYESLARQTKSQPRQKTYLLRALRYRGQAATLQAVGRS
jgi:hypothetical protein